MIIILICVKITSKSSGPGNVNNLGKLSISLLKRINRVDGFISFKLTLTRYLNKSITLYINRIEKSPQLLPLNNFKL